MTAMPLPQTSGIARLMYDPESRPMSSGVDLTTAKVAFNAPRFNERTGTFENGTSFIVKVCAWKHNAAKLLSARKGDEVFIAGHLETREWVDGSGAKKSEPIFQVDNLRVFPKGEAPDASPSTGADPHPF